MSTVIAKFRGVPFHVTNAERSGGRRGAVSEYPKRDDPSFDDQGRKKRGFPVEGFIIGADYLAKHTDLINALEANGPGELVHPFYGSLQVVCLGFNVRLTTTDRIATFSIDFLETPKPQTQPTLVPAAADRVASSALAARESSGVEFLAKFNSGPFLLNAADQLRSVTLAITRAVQTIDMEAQKLALLKRRMTDLDNSVNSLVRAPGDLLVTLAELFDQVEDVGVLKKIYAADQGIRPPATTRSRLLEQVNFDATQRLTQRLAVIRAAELAPAQTYDSYEAAVSARDALTALIDDQALLAADDTYPVLVQLRADLVNAVPGEGSNLPHLLTFTPRSTVCSILLAYELYGDTAHELDLVARNGSSRPEFLTGGLPLEVLSRV